MQTLKVATLESITWRKECFISLVSSWFSEYRKMCDFAESGAVPCHRHAHGQHAVRAREETNSASQRDHASIICLSEQKFLRKKDLCLAKWILLGRENLCRSIYPKPA